MTPRASPQSQVSYSTLCRNNPGYALVQLYAIKYMDAYLDDLGEVGRYDKLMGQIERFRDVGRIMRIVEADDPERAPAMLNALFAGVNAGLTHLEIRKIRRLYYDARDEFDNVVDRIRDSEEQWESSKENQHLRNPRCKKKPTIQRRR